MTHNTPAYLVARVLNSHGDVDYFHAWDAEHGAAFTGRPRAREFDNEVTAQLAASKLALVVPRFVDGRPITYTVRKA